MKKLITLLFITMLMFTSGVLAAGESVVYSGHVEDYGWMDPVADGAMAGTTGQCKRVEAVKINLEGFPEGSHIQYSPHVENYGWMDYVSDGERGGTEGQALRVEAFKIRLVGPAAETHDVYYRTHVSDFGWLGWAKNDAVSGTSGYAKRMEAIEIMVVPKDQPAPGPTGASCLEKSRIDNGDYCLGEAGMSYATYVKELGWTDPVSNGVSGTEGQSLPIESMKASLSNLDGQIEYATHLSNIGWTEPVTDNMESGIPDSGNNVEAITVQLTGNIALQYDIYYRTHVSDFGWMGWAKNGEKAGTSGRSKYIEALEITLVPKTITGPKVNAPAYRGKELAAVPGLRTVQNFLATAMLPVGHTNYVWGGGWNINDNGAGPAAVHIGVYPLWKVFFNGNDASYDYNKTRFQILNGLDCSGYVGWTVYNTLNTQDNGNGEVTYADEMAEWYARKGYGTYTPFRNVNSYLPGDIVSLEEDGHVYICLGTCPDGSVLIAHSSPPGVMITGLSVRGHDSQARQLAHEYMQRYFPEYYSRYANQIDRYEDPFLQHVGQFRWGTNFVGDPDNIRSKRPAEVLKILFGEQ